MKTINTWCRAENGGNEKKAVSVSAFFTFYGLRFAVHRPDKYHFFEATEVSSGCRIPLYDDRCTIGETITAAQAFLKKQGRAATLRAMKKAIELYGRAN